MSFRSSIRSSKGSSRSSRMGTVVSDILGKPISSKLKKEDSIKEHPEPTKSVKIVENMIEECTIHVQMPSYDVIDVPCYRSKTYNPKVVDLKNKISELSCGMDPRRMRLLFKYEELVEGDNLDVIFNTPNCTLQVVYSLVDLDPEHTQMEYTGFIRSISPAEGSINIPVTDSIIVHVAPNNFGHVLRLPAMLDHTMLPTRHDGDMVNFFKGNKRKAEERGFVQWTQQTQSERILLLEVDDQLDLRLDRIRYYTYGVNNGYVGGDMHSWQRYTKNFPVDCKVTIDSLHPDDGGGDEHHTITIKPYAPLKYFQCYALLLCNNVPTVPAGSICAPWTAFTMGGTNEDKLFMFKTERCSSISI